MLWNLTKLYVSKNRASHARSGFSIVELLIVMVVIVILAAIIIVSYKGIQGRAYDSSVQNDLRVASQKFQTIAMLKNGGQFPSGGTVSVADNSYTEFEASKKNYQTDANTNNLIYCAAQDYTTFGMAALSKSGNAFMYTKAGGVQPYPGSWTSLSSDVCPTLVGANYTFSWAYGKTDGWKTWGTATPGF